MHRTLCLLAAALPGCASNPPEHPTALAGVMRAEESVQPQRQGRADTPPPALIDHTPVTRDDLHARMAEAAGAVVLEEVILDRALARTAADAGITVTPAQVDAERTALLATIAQEARLTPEQAEATLASMRRARGLGPTRFEAMLLRNAQLRALCQARVHVLNEEVERAVAIEFGPRFRCRVIQCEDEREAARTRSQIEASLRPLTDFRKTREELEAERAKPLPPERIDLAVAVVGQWAVRASQHESAPRGGSVPELSPADESFPGPLRAVLPTLRPGDVSPIIATGQGAWIVVVEEAIAPTGTPTDADRARVRARLQSRKERMEMDRLARELLDGAGVTVFDPGLRWSWEGSRR
jgi:hypothetical protein